MRTQDEIADRAREQSAKFFDFWAEVLLCFLDYDHAKPLIKPEFTREQWDAMDNSVGGDAPRHPRVLTEFDIPEQMAGYMRFAWGKVSDHRGISAGRSVEKLAALAWLLGDDDVVAFAEDSANYPQYGAPILRHICERYGLPIPDDEHLQRMMQGERCTDDCEEGCGE